MAALARGYDRSLAWALRRRGLMLLATAATLALTAALYAVVPKGFLPAQDTTLVLAVMEAAPDASFAEVNRLQGQVAAAIRRDPAVTGVVSVVGVGPLTPTPNIARLAVNLKPVGERDSANAVAGRLRRAAADIPGVTLFLQPVQDIQIATRSSRSQYQYTLSGAEAGEVASWGARLAERLAREGDLRHVALETQEGGLRAHLTIDREMAGRVGVSVAAINDALNDAFGQRQISTIFGQSNQFRVILEAAPQYQTGPEALSKLYVPGADGAQVPLSSFTSLRRTTAPLSVAREGQFPAATISFDVAPGRRWAPPSRPSPAPSGMSICPARS
jgi:multidrug efflux pump